ncbi:secretin N-terminal domain-containing protein [Synechococcus sp. CBW1107]|uniref:secretin N-terminal domain-containing protein n=1 Tax=Synechococcus sp. CBW1107 TaxID=2789857 RepID=UPI002AD3BFBF|nr:secretin N-terminal domain-containing protein [Synechococcus sp. CBW1107]CAK6694738.1 Type 3 secretion system secretin [Synechococcus sp. CBW1107]
MGSAGLGFRAGLWLGASSTLLATLPLAVTPAPALAQAAIRSDGLQLKLRRLPDALELLIQHVGTGSDLRQQMQGQVWLGELRTPQIRGLKAGPQSLSMTDAGVDSITFDGTGTEFQLKVTPMPGRNLGTPVVSSDGRDLTVRFIAPQLPVSQTARVDLRAPTRVPTSSFVPPLRPRAVAPPSGDIAVGTMTIRNRGYLSLYGPPVTLTTRSANPRDVLMVLSQMGGYGFAFSDASMAGGSNGQGGMRPAPPAPVTVAFQNEPYERAFNFVLLSSGLQARKEGNTILVGSDVLGKTIGPQMSKVYRLNQVAPNSAADYLANLGAQVTKTSSVTTAVSQGVPLGAQPAGSGLTATSQSTTSTQQTVEAFGASSGPLVGLRATTDPRLGTITIVGEPALVAIGEQYLKQLDLRQRQVALSVKILDVTLTNDTEIDNSFAFRFGNNFIVNDGGRLLAAFGRNLPANAQDFSDANTREFFGSSSNSSGNSSSRASNNSASGSTSNNQSGSASGSGNDTSFSEDLTLSLANGRSLEQSQISNVNRQLFRETGTEIQPFEVTRFIPNPNAGVEGELPNIEVTDTEYRIVPTGRTTRAITDDLTSRISQIVTSQVNSGVNIARSRGGFTNSGSSSSSASGSTGSNNSSSGSNSFSDSSSDSFQNYSGSRRRNPGLNYPDNEFFSFLQAQIVSENAKVLASPTLILSENPEQIFGGAEVGGGGLGGQAGDSSGLSPATIGRTRANESFVTVGRQVVSAYDVTTTANVGVSCEPTFSTAGLTFGARVSKIDDNGFVTFTLSPAISGVVDRQPVPGCGFIDILRLRRLDTGSVRVRDGQTLILTGVISDDDFQIVSKWPILGDLPLLGQFFRKTNGSRNKNELVILVTPRIIDDEQGGTYGYGYTPSTRDARRLIYSP